jgi:competence protein ComEA
MARPGIRGAIIILLLLAIISAGAVVLWTKYPRSHPVEISLSSHPEIQGEVYIGGAVPYPGFYPLKAGDTISDVVLAAGGTIEAASGQLELYITKSDEDETAQQVNLNRAEGWLLQALPGIGEARAQAIITYREQNGRFHHAEELMNVEGIGASIYENIKNLITVAD